MKILSLKCDFMQWQLFSWEYSNDCQIKIYKTNSEVRKIIPKNEKLFQK